MTPLLLLLSLLCLAESRISYSGEQVLKCPLKNSSVVQQLWEELDVWGVLPDNTIDVRVKNPQEKRFLESVLDGCKPIIDDVEQEVRKWEAARATASADWFSSYHTYDELDSWYTNFSTVNGDIMDYIPIGKTYQNNTIKALIINVGKTAKPTVYMQALIHAREWAAGTTLNYVLNQLVADFRAGFGNATSLLSKINLHAVPVLNIDGYKFTWSGDRLWRKNRRPNTDKNSACFGTDVNRNYNDHWGMGGSSATPCSDTYMGPSVASELETKATQSYFKSIAPVVYGIDWHCYSQLVLRPYGWTSANSPDETVLAQRGAAYAQTIKDTSGRTYTSQKSIDLYVTTGTASDWFYGDDATGTNSGRRAAGYTVELRPTSSNPGFELPPIEITPCGVENYNAVLPMLNYFASNPLVPSN